MSEISECPFCGNDGIVSFSSYQELLDNWENQFPAIATPDGPIRISSNPRPKDFHKCCNCLMEFSFVDIDIDELLRNTSGEIEIRMLKDHHYPNGPTLCELISTYRTAIVKKPRHTSSYLSDDEINRMIIIPFNYEGVRTYGTFMQDKGSNTYRITGLVRLNL